LQLLYDVLFGYFGADNVAISGTTAMLYFYLICTTAIVSEVCIKINILWHYKYNGTRTNFKISNLQMHYGELWICFAYYWYFWMIKI